MLRIIERYAPIACAAIAAGLAFRFLPAWHSSLAARGEGVASVFGPIFDLAMFSAGSLFAIYVLALSKAEGFLGRIFETKTFSLFHGYVARSIALNVLLFLWTIGYLVLGMGPLASLTPLAIAALWAGLVVWAFCSVARVVIIFLMMVGRRNSKPLGGLAGETP